VKNTESVNSSSFHKLASNAGALKTSVLERRAVLHLLGGAGVLTALGISFTGCLSHDSKNTVQDLEADLIWGRLGLSEGRFQKPRAMVIDANQEIYIVDKTGRIQVFDTDGQFLRHWNTPAIEMGKPTGLGIDRDGNLMVADTHYFRILFYTPQGKLLEDKTIGGSLGPNIGQFAFVTDIVQDREGNFYISEYGEFDRIQKYSSSGDFICRFGESGNEPLQFSRPQSLAIDSSGNLWITDACNHRIQILRCEGDRPELLGIIGSQGDEPGSLRYPYGMWLNDRDEAIVVEYGNHRIQKWNRDGQSLGVWGMVGKKAGQFQQPWAVVQDSKQRLFVLDTGNERVQRFDRLPSASSKTLTDKHLG
jgi:NHL repeat